jgi:hypothetical protein
VVGAAAQIYTRTAAEFPGGTPAPDIEDDGAAPNRDVTALDRAVHGERLAA